MSKRDETVRRGVQRRYGAIAGAGGCCGPAAITSACCGSSSEIGLLNGYSTVELSAVPEGANLGLGCGNPTAIGSLEPGETVLDLGSGAGFDCFLAARKVGPQGRVIGLDMTPEMLTRARANAERSGFTNVEFVEGFIEQIPLPDSSVDVVISNCVINLSVDKPQVFQEVARVLRPGGRMYVSDLVLTRPLPRWLRHSSSLYTACVAGALVREDYFRAIECAGLSELQVISDTHYPIDVLTADKSLARLVRLAKAFPPLRRRIEAVRSLSLTATRPRSLRLPR